MKYLISKILIFFCSLVRDDGSNLFCNCKEFCGVCNNFGWVIIINVFLGNLIFKLICYFIKLWILCEFKLRF